MSSKDLLQHQNQVRNETVKKVTEAMDKIEQDLKVHGYYPSNKGRITVKEVCQIAGIGYSTLKNPTHKSTLTKVRNWLRRLAKMAPTARADAEVIKRARTAGLVDQIDTIARNYNRFKLEYDQLLDKVASLEDCKGELEITNADLERQIETLKKRVTELESDAADGKDTNVIPFSRPDGPPR